MKFLHFSDSHLGYMQYGLYERFVDYFNAFSWALRTAKDLNVDFVVHTGDLFNAPYFKDHDVISRTVSLLNWYNVPFKVICGNHDLPKNRRFSSLLELLDQVVDCVEYIPSDIKCADYRDDYRPLLDNIRYSPILAIHTGVLETAPFAPECLPFEYLNALPVDYVALGHIHVPFQRGKVYQPGALEQTQISHYGLGGAYYYNSGKVDFIHYKEYRRIVDKPELATPDTILRVVLKEGEAVPTSAAIHTLVSYDFDGPKKRLAAIQPSLQDALKEAMNTVGLTDSSPLYGALNKLEISEIVELL